MSFQSIFSAILALLMIQTLISTVTGSPITASAVAETSDPIGNTSLAWPSYLPGWGAVTVFRDKLADEYNMGMLEQSGAWNVIPPVYNIHRPGTGVCDNPYDFPDTDAVSGMICLPDGDDYNSVANDIMPHSFGEMGCRSGPWGCFCTCIVGCGGKNSLPTAFSCGVFIVLIKSSLKLLSRSGPFARWVVFFARTLELEFEGKSIVFHLYPLDFIVWKQSSSDNFDGIMDPSGTFST